MKKMLMRVSCLSAVLLLAVFAMECRAATVTIAPAGVGVYEIRGSDFTSVAGIDLHISYDSTRLASPRVAKGALVTGALMDSNTTNAGNIRIAVITTRPMSGSGAIATITFNLTGSSPGKILSMTASLIDGNGAHLNSQVQVVNPADTGQPDTKDSSNTAPAGDVAAASETRTATSGTVPVTSDGGTSGTQSSTVNTPSTGTATGQPVMLGGVSMPSGGAEQSGKPMTSPIPEMMNKPGGETMPAGMPVTAPTGGNVPGMPVAVPQGGTAPAMVNAVPKNQSVLERFRAYSGERTMAAYTALFDQPGEAGVRQEPAVGLSDGNSIVRLSLPQLASGNTAPNFAFAGARLVSIKKVTGNIWVIEVRPEKGVNSATVTALVNNIARKYPITVAQPLDMKGGSSGLKANERDFAAFLQQRGTDKAPLFDLNRDGKRDYIDDYIFTANYIAATRKQKSGKATSVK